MSEKIRLSVKRNRVLMGYVAAFVMWTGALVISLSTTTEPFSFLVVLFLAAWGFLFALESQATEKRGYARALLQLLGTEYTDPPLNEWEERLESDGAFETDSVEVSSDD